MPLEPSASLDCVPVDWAAPAGVGAFMSTRGGGVSTGPYASLNLGDHVGDDLAHVALNRQRFANTINARPVWLQQVHGTAVIDAASVLPGVVPMADGAWSTKPGLACVVLVADCLPVLIASNNGRAVGAAHAGWRGLAGGVVERTLEAVCSAADCAPQDVHVWLGPCIGPRHFEVGADVLDAFGPAHAAAFMPSAARDGRARWLADLPALARARLAAAGASQVSGGRWCTVEDRSRAFSFRRDGVTGRLAAAVWLRG